MKYRPARTALSDHSGGVLNCLFRARGRAGLAWASLSLLLVSVAAQLRYEGLAAGPLVDVQLEARAQVMAEVGDSVAYSVVASNEGFAQATELVVTHTLPPGFSYQPGSSRTELNGEVISQADPEIHGRSLVWGPYSIPPAWGVFDNQYGVHTFVQDLCVESYVDFQLDKALELVGVGGRVTQLLYPITRSTQGPDPCWVYFVNAAYDRGLMPVLRLQGRWGGDFWIKPKPDDQGDYTSLAQAYKRVVEGLPRRRRSPLYIQIWNEPDLPLEWSGEPSAVEYGNFFVDVANAIHSIGESRIKVLNGALTPGNASFVRQLTTVPGFVQSFDLWASHCYPLNHPPTYNIHNNTARYPRYTVDCYLLELRALAEYGGRRGVKVILSETGYALYDRTFRFEGYPTITEDNRAVYVKRAFEDFWSSWPEVIGVTPFELVDPYNTWPQWDWLFPGTDVPHRQYSVVSGVPKPVPVELHPAELVIGFKAVAAHSPGTYYSDVTAAAANTTVDPLTNVAPVLLVDILYRQRQPLVAAHAPLSENMVASGNEEEWVGDLDELLEGVDLSPLLAESGQRAPLHYLGGDELSQEPWDVLERVHLGPDPEAMAVDAQRRRVYVALNGGVLVTVDTYEWRPLCEVDTGARPGAVGVHRATGAVYVANPGEGTVSVIWGGGCGPVETISGFTRPSDVVLGEQRDRLYVSDAGSGEVVLIDGANGQVATKIPVGVRPGKLALDEARGLLYVADQAEGVLSMIDLETLSVVRTTDVAAGPLLDMVVDGAGGRVYVLHLGPPPRRQVAVIDAQTGEVTASLAGDSDHPLSVINDLALDPQRGTLYLAGVRQMLAVDTASFALNAATPIDAVLYENGMVVDQESGEIYLADNSSGELLVVGPQIGSR